MNRKVGYTLSFSFTCLEDLQSADDYHISMPLSLDYCGEEQCRTSHCWGPAARKDYVLHIVESGKGIFIRQNKTYHLSQGDVFLIEPGEEVFYQADQEDPWKYAWIGFTGFSARGMGAQMGFSETKPVTSLPETEEAVGCIHRIIDARQLTSANYMLRMSEMYRLFAILMDTDRLQGAGQEWDISNVAYVQCAMDFVANNYQKKLRVEDMARAVGISRGHLNRCFKNALSMAPQEYLLNFRMDNAAHLLKETEEPVNIIADMVGYADPLTFSKAFKAKFGMSPKHYRSSEAVLENLEGKGYVASHPL